MLSNKHDDASNYDNLTINSRSGSTLSELLSPIKKVTLSSNSIDYIDKVILAYLIPKTLVIQPTLKFTMALFNYITKNRGGIRGFSGHGKHTFIPWHTFFS